MTRCEGNFFAADNFTSLRLEFPILTASSCDGESRSCFNTPMTLSPVSENDTLTQTIVNLLSTGDSPQLTWVEADMIPLVSNSNIHAVATFPTSTSGKSLVYCCTIESAYSEAKLLSTRDAPKIVTGFPAMMPERGAFLGDAHQITVSGAWAELLFPRVPQSTSSNATVFAQMTKWRECGI